MGAINFALRIDGLVAVVFADLFLRLDQRVGCVPFGASVRGNGTCTRRNIELCNRLDCDADGAIDDRAVASKEARLPLREATGWNVPRAIDYESVRNRTRSAFAKWNHTRSPDGSFTVLRQRHAARLYLAVGVVALVGVGALAELVALNATD